MGYDDLVSGLSPAAEPGDVITFGGYPHLADGTHLSPVKWRVLAKSGRELFLLSEYILECKRYHGEFVDTTWRDCDLRKWLNDEFYHSAFNAVEKAIVKTSRCTDNGEGSPDTKDKVFLLSVAEVKSLTGALGKDFRRAAGTEFARAKKADGCRLYVYDKGVEEDYLTENGKRIGCSWWWLRTQPSSRSRAAFVGARASIRSYCRVNRVSYGVRPAIKLALA